jgi:hypothetical protein
MIAGAVAALALGLGGMPPPASFSPHVDNPWFPLHPVRGTSTRA